MPISTRSLWPSRNWDSILAAIAGILIIHSFCRHSGIGVSPDSVDYLSTASNIRHHGSASNFTGSPLVNFPLGYPILLSAIEWITGKDAVAFGPVLNEALFAILILLCGVLLERCALYSKWYKWGLLTILVLSPCLLEIYSMLWSETLFLVLLLLFLLFMQHYLQSPQILPPLSRLWAPAAIAALACVTRYAGITLIAAGGLLILLLRGVKMRHRFRHALIFVLVSSSLLAINLARNALATGTLTGHREAGIIPLANAFGDYCLALLTWLGVNMDTDHGGWYNIGGCLLVILVALLFFRRWHREGRPSVGRIAILYFSVYSVFIILSATLSRFQTLDSRLLSPLFIPLVIGIAGEFSSLPRPRRYLMQTMPLTWKHITAFVILVAVFQWGQIKTYRENWEGIRDAGIPGYTEDDWQHSQTMKFVREQKDSTRGTPLLYSNANDAIWFLTGQHSLLLPHKDFQNDIRALVAQDRFYVAWFNDGYNPDLVNIGVIGRYKRVAWVKRFEDGAVYYFTSP